MITSVEVFGKIKEMNTRTFGSRNRILISEIADELPVPSDTLLVLLTELQNRGLIIIHKTPIATVSLTNYGVKEDTPPGGLDSE
jgi:hypothetical protein